MKKIFLLLFASLATYSASAQTAKLTPATRVFLATQSIEKQLAKNKEAATENNVFTTILLNKGCEVSDETLNVYGAQVEKRCGRLLFAYVPVSKLQGLTAIEGICSIDTGHEMKPYNDLSRDATSVAFVHRKEVEQEGEAAPVYYRGKGVMVGIIDHEIDFGHPVFSDAEGKSRIKQAHYTYFNSEGKTERKEFGESNLQECIDERMSLEVTSSHGTHVAGIAAGSTDSFLPGNSMKQYYGMAPEADILAYDLVNFASNDVLYSLTSAFEKSKAENRPVVVNMSFGSIIAQIDGQDEFSKKIEAIYENYGYDGKIICVASGNEASRRVSAQMECDNPIVDGNWTFQKKLACFLTAKTTNLVSFCGADNKEFAVRYDFYHLNGSEFGKEPFASTPLITSENAGEMQEKPFHIEGVVDDTDYSFDFIPETEVSPNNRFLQYGVFMPGDSQNFYVVANIFTKDEGMKIDAAVANSSFMNMSDDEYVLPNNLGSLSIHAASDDVISVGAFVTRTTYTDTERDRYTLDQFGEEGDITLYSSFSDEHYGRPRPDVVAPGLLIISALHHNAKGRPIVGTMTRDGVEYKWGAMDGTSMATPAVSGIVALWLQADPTLTVNEIREVISKTSDFDSHCSKAFPCQAGYGKINALAGLRYILSTLGIKEINADNTTAPLKYLDKDNRLVIRKGDRIYDSAGALLQ